MVDLDGLVVHVGHGVALTDPERFPPREQERAKTRWARVDQQPWMRALRSDDALDG